MNSNTRRTYLTYFGFLVVILAIVGYSARNVIFRPWTARSWVSTATLDGRIYLFGGKNSQNELMQDVLSVDPSGNTLKRVGHSTESLFGSGATALNGRIYVAGGMDKRSISNRVEQFNPADQRFTPLTRLPSPRAFGSLVAVSGSLYYMGGWDGDRTSDDIIRIDPATGATRIVAHLPAPLEEFASTTHNGVVYLIGGVDAAGNFVRSIYGILPESGKVVATGRLDAAVARMSATTLGGTIYVTGGWNGKELRSLYRINPAASMLTLVKVAEIEYPILDASLSADKNSLYLIGGREHRYRRQVQILQINPSSGATTNLLLRSYAWW